MRIALVFLVLLVVACDAENVTKPPTTRDRLAELRNFDPTAPHVRPNPAPLPWMRGCYSIQLPADARYPANYPRVVQLTSQPTRMFGTHQLYAVRVENAEPRMSSWEPFTSSEIRVNIGTGLEGWAFSLARSANGLAGTGQAWSDVPRDRPLKVPATFQRTPCP